MNSVIALSNQTGELGLKSRGKRQVLQGHSVYLTIYQMVLEGQEWTSSLDVRITTRYMSRWCLANMSKARKLFRLFKSVNEYHKLVKFLDDCSEGLPFLVLGVITRIGLAVFWLFDNL